MYCKNCQEKFVLKRKWQNFCSDKCRNNYWNKRKKIVKSKEIISEILNYDKK